MCLMNKKCPWRIYASINSSSIRVVFRSFNDVHNCTWQDRVSLLTNARIADIYIEEFRINPNISAKQLQKKLIKREYEVTYFNDRFVVQMRGEPSYGCRMYKVSGIPCCHMLSALRMERHDDQDLNLLLSHWFTVEKLRSCYATPLKAVGGMNMWNSTDACVNPPPYKRPPGRPPGKKRKREVGETRPGMIPKRGTKIHCGLCGQEGHNRLYCKSLHVDKPPSNPRGRPRIRPVTEAPMMSSQVPNISASSSQALVVASQLVAQSQPMEDLPNLSAALPKRRRGRPRKSQFDGVSSSQPNLTTPREPIYDTGPVHLPREGVGLFTSSITGDDYIAVGSRVTDTSDNTILQSTLYRSREKKKLAARAAAGGKNSEKSV
ncbi:unnamed protein product, partial [Thlaspi arvense]